MTALHPLVAIARDLARLSGALADALEAGDLERAEQLLAARGHLLEAAHGSGGPATATPTDLALIADARQDTLAADGRSAAALRARIEELHDTLSTLAAGARAARAYLAPDAMVPGWVDRRD